MADMFDCGRYTFRTWKEGQQHQVRWLGPFNPDMPLTEVHERLDDYDKITPEAIAMFDRGWNAEKNNL